MTPGAIERSQPERMNSIVCIAESQPLGTCSTCTLIESKTNTPLVARVNQANWHRIVLQESIEDGTKIVITTIVNQEKFPGGLTGLMA